MKKNHYCYLIPASLFASIIFYAIINNLIIFRSPFEKTLYQRQCLQHSITKKKVTLWFWHHNRWNHENTDIIWNEDKSKTIKHLVISWLNVLDEEQITKQKISLQSAAITVSGQEALISFDQNLLNQECSVFNKLMLIEGLLKTIRENNIKLQGIYFLVHHKPLEDYHLDFSNPWPLSGYLQIK